MKAKHVFVTLGVALTMGLGIAAGIRASEDVRPAKAATATLYFDVSSTTWWNEAGALTFAHCFDGGPAATTWPGAQMSLVSGSTTKYSVEIDAAYTHVIFTRVNPSNPSQVWNRTSKDGGTPINLPTDYSVKNQWNLTADGSNYNDGNYCGNWTLYTPPATTYSVDVYVDGEKRGTETIAEGELPLAPSKFGKTFSGQWYDNLACSEGHEVDGVTSNDPIYCKLTALPTVTYILDVSAVSSTFTNKYLYAWDDGGTNAGWPGEEMENSTFEIPNDAKLIITNGPGTTRQTVDITQSGVANDTLKILNDTVHEDDKDKYTYQWASEETVTYSYSLNGAAYIDMDVNPKDPSEVYVDDLDLSKGDKLTFQRNDVDIVINPKEDALLTNVFLNGDDELELAADYEDGIYLDTSVNQLWAGQFASGYYLCGSFCDWNVKLGTPAELEELGKQVYYVNSIALDDDAEMKMIYVPNNSKTVTYYDADAEKVSTNTGVEYSVTEGDSNLKVASASNYGVYYDVESGWYGIEDRDYHEPVYTLKIGDGEPIEMTKGDDNQYYVSGVDLPGDVVLSYAVDGVTVDDSTAKVVANNNMKANKHVLATVEDVDVYVNVSTKTIWAGGLEYETYYLFKNYASDRQAIELTHGDPFGEYDQYYSALLSFEQGDTIEFINTGVDYASDALPSIFHPGIINEGGLGNRFELVDNVITCKTDAPEVSVYLKLKFGMDEVYFGDKPEYVDDAITFAENFNSLIGTACSIEDLGNREAQVKAKWAQMAIAWGDLSELSQNYLKTDKSNPTVQAFNAKYDSVLALRGTVWALNDFMDKNNPSNTIRPINVIGSNSALLITLVAVSALIVSGALAFYVLRKKRLVK